MHWRAAAIDPGQYRCLPDRSRPQRHRRRNRIDWARRGRWLLRTGEADRAWNSHAAVEVGVVATANGVSLTRRRIGSTRRSTSRHAGEMAAGSPAPEKRPAASPARHAARRADPSRRRTGNLHTTCGRNSGDKSPTCTLDTCLLACCSAAASGVGAGRTRRLGLVRPVHEEVHCGQLGRSSIARPRESRDGGTACQPLPLPPYVALCTLQRHVTAARARKKFAVSQLEMLIEQVRVTKTRLNSHWPHLCGQNSFLGGWWLPPGSAMGMPRRQGPHHLQRWVGCLALGL